jgi:glycosidase
MLANDRARIEMAHSLMLTLPGTPVLRYGDEIGMGEDLSLNERDSVRTPMQWPMRGTVASRQRIRGSFRYHPSAVADSATRWSMWQHSNATLDLC